MILNDFLRNFAAQFIEPDNHVITPNVRFRELPTYDSLTGMAVLAMLQDEYGVNIPVDEYLKVNTPAELFELIKSKKIQ
jgi:acyl carrier protein